MQSGDLLIEVLGQHVHGPRVGGGVGPQLDLGEHLVRERVAHHETGVPGRVAEVHQPALREHQHTAARGQPPLVHLRLDLDPLGTGQCLEAGDVDLVVEVAHVGYDRQVLHAEQVLDRDHVEVPGAGDEDVDLVQHRLDPGHLEAVHGGLQRADRVDLGDDHPRALAAERLRGALADVPVAGDEGDLAAHQHVGGAVQAVGQRVPDAVLVVELALGHRVVDVDCGEQQVPRGGQFVEPVHAGRGLLADPLDPVGDRPPAVGALGQRPAQHVQDQAVFGAVGGCGVRHGAGQLELAALVHQQGGVAAVIEDQVGPAIVGALGGGLRRPVEDLRRGPPVLLQGLALPGEHRDAGRFRGGARADDDRGSGIVLGREDVAARPAHSGAEVDQGLDQHGRLHGHVQAAGDAGSGEGLAGSELLAQGHQAGHLVLGEAELVATGFGQAKIGDTVRQGDGRRRSHGSIVP